MYVACNNKCDQCINDTDNCTVCPDSLIYNRINILPNCPCKSSEYNDFGLDKYCSCIKNIN
jgi:hypothetical protein